jgi:hypothetical protein
MAIAASIRSRAALRLACASLPVPSSLYLSTPCSSGRYMFNDNRLATASSPYRTSLRSSFLLTTSLGYPTTDSIDSRTPLLEEIAVREVPRSMPMYSTPWSFVFCFVSVVAFLVSVIG